MFLQMGNANPKQALGRDENDKPIFGPSPGPSVTSVGPIYDIGQAFLCITTGGEQSIWGQHSYDESPTWVSCEETDAGRALAQLVAAHFGCPVGAPDDLEEQYHTIFGPPGVGEEAAMDALAERENYDETVVAPHQDDEEGIAR